MHIYLYIFIYTYIYIYLYIYIYIHAYYVHSAIEIAPKHHFSPSPFTIRRSFTRITPMCFQRPGLVMMIQLRMRLMSSFLQWQLWRWTTSGPWVGCLRRRWRWRL